MLGRARGIKLSSSAGFCSLSLRFWFGFVLCMQNRRTFTAFCFVLFCFVFSFLSFGCRGVLVYCPDNLTWLVPERALLAGDFV